jgi:hypothetical protein
LTAKNKELEEKIHSLKESAAKELEEFQKQCENKLA